MMNRKQNLGPYALPFVILVLLLLFVSGNMVVGEESAQKPHPTLVNPESSNCTTCHDDIADKQFVHAVLNESGCDACHEMSKENNKVLVGFVEKGNALCFACHSEIEEASGKKYPHAVVEEGCETCHKPHSSEHKHLLTGSMEQLCADCHDIKEEDFKKKHGRQPVERFGCGTCHETHGSDQETLMKSKFKHVPFQEGECNACHRRARGKNIRLRGAGAKLCYACHSDKEEEFAKGSIHTPIKKGECSGCHDPHMAGNKALLKDKGKGLCLGCHKEIETLLKADTVHAPAEEACLDCHASHVSKFANQLTQAVVPLCLECHDAEEQAFKSSHYQQKAQDLDCGECHNPHGSQHKKLMNTYPHAPFLEKECESCHEDVGSAKKIKLTAESISELCLTCHDDKGSDDSKKDMVTHGALEAEDCTACHSAHAASRDHILKDHTSRLCLTCHDDRAEEREKPRFIHPVIDSVGCEACHDSHFSKNEKLLVETPNKLCIACHLKTRGNKSSGKEKPVTLFGKIKLQQAHLDSFKKILLSPDLSRGHPQGRHVVSANVTEKSLKNKRLKGLTFMGQLTCLSCHDAHAGASPQLFLDGIAGQYQLCLKCHSK